MTNFHRCYNHFFDFYHITTLRNITSLRLTNNNLTSLLGLAVSKAKNFTYLDLRHNKISSLIELSHLKGMTGLTDLLLDGNPICGDFYDEISYIKAIRRLCPTIERLDGVPLGCEGFVQSRRNFLCAPAALKFVDHFLEYFFTAYDIDSRVGLINLYHKSAFFSLTSAHVYGQITSYDTPLSNYTSHSHNVLKMSDLSRGNNLLQQGSHNICAFLCSLPQTRHDPLTFTVDLLHYTQGHTLIAVSGVFKETFCTGALYGFYRTFSLKSVGNDCFKITNDMLFISNATTVQARSSFKIKSIEKPLLKLEDIKLCDVDKNQIVGMLCQLSTMNGIWSVRFLQESKWNLRDALTTFLSVYKNGKLPPEAFVATNNVKKA